MYALSHGSLVRYQCGNYASANLVFDELMALAEEKGTLFWKAFGLNESRLRVHLDGPSVGRSPPDHLCTSCAAVNGNDDGHAVPFVALGARSS